MKSQSLLKNILHVLAILVISNLAVASYATAASLDEKIEALQIDVPRVREIIQLVAKNEGYPTKQLHDEFWGLILTRIPSNPRIIGESFSASLIQPMQYQRELWNSIQLSAMSHSVVSTEKLAALRSQIPTSKLTKDYIEREDLMLQAAATGQPYVTRSGENWNLTVEVAKNNIAGLAQTEERLRKLYNPDWQ
jgi:hypothetical protein